MSQSRARWARRKGSPRKTGPSQETREAVFERDQYRCARCGRHIATYAASIQHRKPRGMGGTKDPSINSPANLILLCGDGVRGCHGHIEQHREEAKQDGYGVAWWEDPTIIPVKYWDGRTYKLDNKGGRECLDSTR